MLLRDGRTSTEKLPPNKAGALAIAGITLVLTMVLLGAFFRYNEKIVEDAYRQKAEQLGKEFALKIDPEWLKTTGPEYEIERQLLTNTIKQRLASELEEVVRQHRQVKQLRAERFTLKQTIQNTVEEIEQTAAKIRQLDATIKTKSAELEQKKAHWRKRTGTAKEAGLDVPFQIELDRALLDADAQDANATKDKAGLDHPSPAAIFITVIYYFTYKYTYVYLYVIWAATV